MIADIHINIVAGTASAVFAVLVGTSVSQVGLRNYIMILTAAVLCSFAVVEYLFVPDGKLSLSCLTGFCIGWVADDVLMTLNAAIPPLIRDIANDAAEGIKGIVRNIFKRK